MKVFLIGGTSVLARRRERLDIERWRPAHHGSALHALPEPSIFMRASI